MRFIRLLLLLLLSVVLHQAYTQQVSVSGRITDAETNEPIPFASVTFTNQNIRATSDFEGRYSFVSGIKPDSVKVQVLGFNTRTKAVPSGEIVFVDFQLSPQRVELTTAVIRPKANPAFRILDSVLVHEKFNSPEYLNAYECENFTRIELALNNIPAKLKESRFTRKLGAILDSAGKIAGEDGKPVIPVFVSEAVSDYYYLGTPLKIKEHIKASKITGVGVEDGSTISQLTGSVFQKYNFYSDWILIVDKQFPSPLSSHYKTHYYYKIIDSQEVNSKKLYQIQIRKRPRTDLAFTGTIWIEDSTFALRRIVLEVDKSANLNFIEKIKLQQEFEPTNAGPWLPTKTRISIDVEQPTKNTSGILAKYYSSSSKIVAGNARPANFFNDQISISEDSKLYADSFWIQKRGVLGGMENKSFYKMVDSLKNIKTVKTYVDYVELFLGGYKRLGKVEVGSYVLLYSHNIVEGSRFRIGARTNYLFNRNIYFNAYTAYGLQDHKFKYGGGIDWVIKRSPWVKASYEYKKDLEAVGLVPPDQSSSASLFSAVSLFTRINRWGWVNLQRLTLEAAPGKEFTGRLRMEYKQFSALEPAGGWHFAYTDPSTGNLKTSYINSAVTLEGRYSKTDAYIQNDYSRINVGDVKGVTYSLAYTLGVKGFAGSNFNYQRIKANIKQNIFLKKLGTGTYNITFSKFFNPLPYPMLDVQFGNQSFIYSSQTFSLMDFAEFVADQSVSAEYEHHFEGLFFNRIPIVKKWKLRLFANTRGVWGGMSAANQALTPLADDQGKTYTRFRQFSNIPYLETGYGVENIFRLFRVDFVHRLTYLSQDPLYNKSPRHFGVKFSIQFKF